MATKQQIEEAQLREIGKQLLARRAESLQVAADADTQRRRDAESRAGLRPGTLDQRRVTSGDFVSNPWVSKTPNAVLGSPAPNVEIVAADHNYKSDPNAAHAERAQKLINDKDEQLAMGALAKEIQEQTARTGKSLNELDITEYSSKHGSKSADPGSKEIARAAQQTSTYGQRENPTNPYGYGMKMSWASPLADFQAFGKLLGQGDPSIGGPGPQISTPSMMDMLMPMFQQAYNNKNAAALNRTQQPQTDLPQGVPAKSPHAAQYNPTNPFGVPGSSKSPTAIAAENENLARQLTGGGISVSAPVPTAAAPQGATQTPMNYVTTTPDGGKAYRQAVTSLLRRK